MVLFVVVRTSGNFEDVFGVVSHGEEVSRQERPWRWCETVQVDVVDERCGPTFVSRKKADKG